MQLITIEISRRPKPIAASTAREATPELGHGSAADAPEMRRARLYQKLTLRVAAPA